MASEETLPKWQQYAADEDKEHDSWTDKTPYESRDDVTYPAYKTDDAAGIDLPAAHHGTVPAHGRLLVNTGVKIGFQEYHFGMIAPRSGICAKNGIVPASGIIDNKYQGEIGVVLFNHSNEDFSFAKGDRIAQLIIMPFTRVDLVRVPSIVDIRGRSKRGADGFGSTGA